MRVRIGQLLAGAAALATLCGASFGASVSLRASASVPVGRDVVLADVADLDAAALELAGTRVLSAEEAGKRAGGAGETLRLTLADVRAALAAGGVVGSRVALNGSACTLRVGELDARPAAAAPTEAGSTAATAADLMTGEPTVKGRIAQAMLGAFDAEAHGLRLTFDARDAERLNQPEGGRTLIVRPLSSAPESGRVVVEVRTLENGREVGVSSYPVSIEVLRRGVRLTRDLGRRAEITATDLEPFEGWVSPGEARAGLGFGVTQAVGLLTRSRLKAGTVVTPDALVPAVAVRRNEWMDVWVYRGGVALKARAMAMKDGGVGDTIPAKLERQRTPFQVKIDGERRGVVIEPSDTPGPAAP